MPITVCGTYTCDGPFGESSELENRSGVYIILRREPRYYFIVDVGESARVRDRVESHDRIPCWRRQGFTHFAVYYTPNFGKARRMEIERDIRRKHSPPCGDR